MKLAKASIPYRALKDIGTLLAIVVFSGNLSFQTLNPAFIFLASSVFLAVVAVSLLWEYVVWRRYDYFFEEDSLRITHGVFRRNEREIPYRRIQNVKINRNIVHRVLEIGKVDFETAGGAETEASLKYVSESEARDIQEKIRNIKRSDEDEVEEKKEREKAFELSEHDLIAYSLLSLNAGALGAIFVGFSLVAGLLGGFFDSVSLGPAVVISVLFVVVLGGSWLVNAAWNYLQYYDFKLWMEDDTLEYERGLLNRSEGSIPLEKVQGLSIKENFLMRPFNFASLSIETAGGPSNQDDQSVNTDKVAIPLAKRPEVIGFGQKLEAFQSFDLESIPERARMRYMARYSLAVLLLTGVGFAVDSLFFSFSYWALLLLLPAAALGAQLKWGNKAFQMQEDYFIAVNGFWSRRTSVTPYYRIQNLIQTEGLFQRRWSLSTLELDTAGSSIFDDSKAVDLDVGRAEEVRVQVFERFKNSLMRG